MATTRQNKVSRLLLKELGDILQRERNSMFTGKMVTVTNVRITSDLGQARVFLSIFPAVDKEEFLETMEEKAGYLRYELGNRIRHQLRSVPELNFFLDDSLDYIDNIDRLLKT
ncbi:30S ribosome-binding factor RbfA [Bacteroidota bacterium]